MALAFAGIAQLAQAAGITMPLGGRPLLETLAGTYVSVGAENWYRGYDTRAFSFDKGKWELTFVSALDPGMTQKVFEFHAEGPYKLAGTSNTQGRIRYDLLRGREGRDLEDDRRQVDRGDGDGRLQSQTQREDRHLEVRLCTLEAGRPMSRRSRSAGYRCCRQALPRRSGGHDDMCTPDKRPTALLPAVIKKN